MSGWGAFRPDNRTEGRAASTTGISYSIMVMPEPQLPGFFNTQPHSRKHLHFSEHNLVPDKASLAALSALFSWHPGCPLTSGFLLC